MKKDNDGFSSIHALHQAGQFVQAEEGYLALLRKNPNEIEVLHALGVLYTQQKNFTDAIYYLQIALKYQPNNPILQLHLANVFKMQGLYSQAVEILQKSIQMNPHYIPALNNLGTVYYAQGKLADAVRVYRLALEKQSDYIYIYYNLGLALVKQNAFEEAVGVYQALLERSPEHFAARFHLGCVLMQQEKMTDALQQFLVIAEKRTHHVETEVNIATCYLKIGDLNEAKLHYLKALALTPHDTQILFNLGVINMQQGHIDNAIQNYQQVVLIHPDFFAAHNNLGVAFLAKQHAGFALHHFQEALRLQPNNQSIHYIVKMLAQNQRLLAAPPDYIKSLFDAYADHYEPHLVNLLDYTLPQKLHDAVYQVVKMAPHSYDILDLGCGTGLCGVLFKSYAKSLTGVDLSEKMLEIAAQKNIYNTLVTDDLVHFLENKNAMYDLIVAGDALVYIGDLHLLFDYVNHALRADGLFVFNTEICIDHDYQMNQSGRFSHQQTYLEQLAHKNQLDIAFYQSVITRMQNNEPVYGYLYVLQKALVGGC